MVLMVVVVVFAIVVSALFWPITTTAATTTPITTITQCTINYSTPTYITTATNKAVDRVANVILVGVVYLSICLAVGMVVVVVLVEMGGEEWLLLAIFCDGGIVGVVSLVDTF